MYHAVDMHIIDNIRTESILENIESSQEFKVSNDLNVFKSKCNGIIRKSFKLIKYKSNMSEGEYVAKKAAPFLKMKLRV